MSRACCQILMIRVFDLTQVKLLVYLASIPFDYLLVSLVTNYAYNRAKIKE